MTDTKYTFCRICEATCGLAVEVDNNTINNIQPDTSHPVSKGYACVKGLSLAKFVNSPDRITQPLKRIDGQLQPITWDQAISEIAGKLKAIHQQHGGPSIGLYVGNPIGFNLWTNTITTGFLKGVGSDKLFTAGTQDCTNKFATADRIYGSYMRQTFPDIDHTNMLIALGSNPVISKMSFIHLPHPADRIQAIEQRGGKVVWVNPRKTESAKRCGEHLAIRPNTDVFFMLSFLHEVIAQGGVDKARVKQFTEGFDQLALLAEHWSAEKTAPVTRIPADTLKQLVKDYLAADGAAIYSSTGVNQGSFGTLTVWLQEAINAITGNLDKRGGTLMGKPPLDLPDTTEPQYSRINNTPYISGIIPAGIMADEILEPGEGQVRALFVNAGNPILSCANSQRQADAFKQLELMVSIDLFRNETSEYADYVLPGLHFLERADIPFYFLSGMGVTPDRFFHYTDPVLAPPGEARNEALIFRQIASAAGLPLFDSKWLQFALDAGEKLSGLPGCKENAEPRFYSLLGRQSGIGNLKKWRQKPHGELLEANQPGDYLNKRMQEHNHRIQLAPKEFIERAQGLQVFFDKEKNSQGLRLISKRERFSHNSWTHNLKNFVKGSRNTNYLYIHPQDAQQLNLQEGQLAEVSANEASIVVPVKIDSDFSPGTVSVPHGWGHQEAPGLSIAQKTQGANVNILASDGPNAIEPVSGMSQLTGIPVAIRAATSD